MSELQGYEGLRKRFAAIQDNRKLLGQLAGLAVAEAAKLAPVKTGNLRRSIRIGTVSESSASIIAGGRGGVGYAAIVERGSRPHVIVPRNRKVLAWGGNRRLSGSLRTGARATNFARRVNHPGTRAKPYLLPGAQAAASKAGFAQQLIKTWNEAA
jgi:hypothetical protein